MTKTARKKNNSRKLLTGIQGLDEILRGGLPRNRNTLITGSAGCGKTVLSLQTMVNAARNSSESGIFVALEESSTQIIENAESFGWDLPDLLDDRIFFLDAQLTPEIVRSGDFDLSALLAVIGQKARQMKASHVVFDGLDMLIELLDSPEAERREILRLYHWLLASGLTGIITAKPENSGRAMAIHTGRMEFMSDCVICLDHGLESRFSMRSLRVVKYRGSAFSENAVPLSIGNEGIEISADISVDKRVPVTTERISTGVERLDAMLDGGYLRGSGILISGAPGTSKSTLAAAFTEASCLRGEKALYVTFDESAAELVRNFLSVGINLEPHITSKRLVIHSIMADDCNAKQHLVTIQSLLRSHQPDCLVVDPISGLIKSGGDEIAQNIAERITRLCKASGITVLNTSLLNSADQESTPIQISTIADTWIHLSYLVHAGERNRALSVVKSRGTDHSNQVRELILSDDGITLTDAYTADGEVLMGTLRWQRERADFLAEDALARESQQKLRAIDQSIHDLSEKMENLRSDIEVKRAEQEALAQAEDDRLALAARRRESLSNRRQSDPKSSIQKKP